MEKSSKSILFALLVLICLGSCLSESDNNQTGSSDGTAVFLLIDEESIDNGNEPNDFSDTDVNDQLADIRLRTPLRYFWENEGKSITLFTAQIGDEGWFAL